MKSLKLIAAGAAVAGTLGLAAAGRAQTGDTVVFGGVGSSALFATFEKAAIGTAGLAHYSAKNAALVRETGANDEKANLWVVWTAGTDAAGDNKKIYFYDQVDSVVGNRAFFNKDTNVLVSPLPAPANINAPNITGDTTVPPDVQTAINNSVFNAGMTDITPYDALIQTQTARALLGGAYVASGIQSAVNGSKVAYPVNYDFHNYPNFVVTKIGATPILFFVNKSANLANATNIDRFTLAAFLSGQLTTTDSIDITQNPNNGAPVTTFIREPLSGTYTTTEFCVPEAVEIKTTQENGVKANPLNETGYTIPLAGGFSSTPPAQGGRVRAVGTGDLVNATNTMPDSLGYAFFSIANFAGKSNLKYLTLDGCDPISSGYTNGAIPGFGSTVSLATTANGGYGAWSILRMITGGAIGGDLSAYINQVRGTDSGGDFVSADTINVFRSHRQVGPYAPHNGNLTSQDSGADAGGAVYPNNAEQDLGVEIINQRQ